MLRLTTDDSVVIVDIQHVTLGSAGFRPYKRALSPGFSVGKKTSSTYTKPRIYFSETFPRFPSQFCCYRDLFSMATTLGAPDEAPTKQPVAMQKIRKRRLYDFPAEFWSNSPSATGDNVTAILRDEDEEPKPETEVPDISSLVIANHDTCNTCNLFVRVPY